MENHEKATQVLDRQITEVRTKINQAKIIIADVFIKTASIDVKDIRTPRDVLPFIEEMEKMAHSLSTVKVQEKVLAVLIKSRAEIETAST